MRLYLNNTKPVFVDGFHEASNTVYEFFGCNFYRCILCHSTRRDQTRYCHPDRTIAEVYEATLKKVAELKAAGYNVVEKWECQYAKEREKNPALKAFVDSLSLVTPLEPRDAFFGGRTGATTSYAKAEENETIAYVDYTSLYPYINKYGIYLTGFSQI